MRKILHIFLLLGQNDKKHGNGALAPRLKERKYMKRIILVLLTVSLLVGIFTIGAQAFFGVAADVAASDVTLIKTGLLGKKLTFNDTDFKSALCLSDFESIKITKLPSSNEGTLLLGGRRLGEGKSIKRKNIASLVFIPASASVTEASFSFTAEGYMGGAEVICTMRFIDKINYAPKAAEDAETVKTQASICTYGKMIGSDPEGDKIEFITVSYPKHGILSITSDDGASYIYTPTGKYTGTDSFTYVVRDEYGNYSLPCTVKISITERMCSTEYRDMAGTSAYNAAVAMSAMGVMSGTLIGDDMYFMPEGEITRAEFVAMAMKSCGIRKDTTLTKSFFDDDADIPTSLTSYVATAQRIGIISGDFEGGRLVFKPNQAITKYEAAKIMATLIGVDKEGEESVFGLDDGTPAWARPSVNAMFTLGIFTEEEDAVTTEKITKGECAVYLYRLADRA